MNAMKSKAIFLDRDGVINHVVFHEGIPKASSPWNISEFKLIEGIEKPLEMLHSNGFLLFIISNQPDISRGNIEEGTTERINEILYEKFPVKEIMVCPHDDKDNCSCRKPKPGMILQLAEKYNIDLKDSYVIGDGLKDMKAGEAAGCTCILIDTPYNKNVSSDIRVNSLADAVEIIDSKSS